MENPPQKDSTPTTPTGAIKPVPEKRRHRWVPVFVLGMVAGVGLAIAWPRLAPLATCLKDIAQNEFPIPTGTEGDADWVKVYGEMKPARRFGRVFGPTYNQLLDFYDKFVRPVAPYPNAPQEARDDYQAQLQEWQQRMCKIQGLCVAQTDKSGAAASP